MGILCCCSSVADCILKQTQLFQLSFEDNTVQVLCTNKQSCMAIFTFHRSDIYLSQIRYSPFCWLHFETNPVISTFLWKLLCTNKQSLHDHIYLSQIWNLPFTDQIFTFLLIAESCKMLIEFWNKPSYFNVPLKITQVKYFAQISSNCMTIFTFHKSDIYLSQIRYLPFTNLNPEHKFRIQICTVKLFCLTVWGACGILEIAYYAEGLHKDNKWTCKHLA